MITDFLEYISLFLVMIVQVIIPPIPAELVIIAAAREYGLAITTLVAGFGLYVGSVLVYFFAKQLQKHSFFKKEKAVLVIKNIRRYEDVLLWVRILPYNPSDIISYAAGIIQIPAEKFLVVTAITSFVRCFLLASLGLYVTSLASASLVLFVLILSAVIGYKIVWKK